jgi:hypothetical protein
VDAVADLDFRTELCESDTMAVNVKEDWAADWLAITQPLPDASS